MCWRWKSIERRVNCSWPHFVRLRRKLPESHRLYKLPSYLHCLFTYFFALPPPLQWRWYCENERWSFKTLVERSLVFTASSRNPSKHTKPSDSQFTTVTNVSLVNRNHSTGPDALDWQNLFGPAKNLDKICLCQMFNLSSVDALRQQSIC